MQIFSLQSKQFIQYANHLNIHYMYVNQSIDWLIDWINKYDEKQMK